MPSDGSLAMRPKMMVNTSIVSNGRITAHNRPDHGLLVPNRQIAPGQHPEQLPISPEVEPIVALCSTGLNDSNFVHRNNIAILRCIRDPASLLQPVRCDFTLPKSQG